MFPLALLNKSTPAPPPPPPPPPLALVLSCSFATDFTDSSSYNTPISTVAGTPSFVDSSLYLPSGARIRTGSVDNQPQPHLSLYNKLYTIEFDIKMQSAAYPTIVLDRGSSDSANTQSIIIDSAANTIVVSNISYTGIFAAYSLGFDSKAAFFNVKFKRTSLTDYELLINGVVVRSTSGYTSGVMDDNTNSTTYHGFRIGQAATRPFYIKNFKVTTS